MRVLQYNSQIAPEASDRNIPTYLLTFSAMRRRGVDFSSLI